MTYIQKANLTVMLAVGLVTLLFTQAPSVSSTGLDCFVADEPSVDGPAAPSDLQASLSPDQPYGLIDIQWSDNSDDETCFVLELRFNAGDQTPFDVKAVIPGGASVFSDGPYSEGTFIQYRVYAADASRRSEYSGIAEVGVLFIDTPFPTVPPTPAPTFQRADLNCDGSIDAVDALVVLREDAGLDPNLPADCPALTSVVGVTEIAAGGAVAGVAGLALVAGVLVSRRRSSSGDIAD